MRRASRLNLMGDRCMLGDALKIIGTHTHKNKRLRRWWIILFLGVGSNFILLLVISNFKITLDYLFFIYTRMYLNHVRMCLFHKKRCSFFISYTARKFFLKVSLQSSLRRNSYCKDAAAKFHSTSARAPINKSLLVYLCSSHSS